MNSQHVTLSSLIARDLCLYGRSHDQNSIPQLPKVLLDNFYFITTTAIATGMHFWNQHFRCQLVHDLVVGLKQTFDWMHLCIDSVYHNSIKPIMIRQKLAELYFFRFIEQSLFSVRGRDCCLHPIH